MQAPMINSNLLINSRTVVYIYVLLFLFLYSSNCSAQGKEANIWYFGWGAGIDFNQGTPPTVLTNSQMYIMTSDISGSASIADSTGSLLFYSDGVHIWNKEHQHMQNGQWIGHNSTQGAMIVPMQGNNHLYYFFNYDLNSPGYDFQYSIIDMNLDNGLGGVVEGKKGVYLLSNSAFHLSAVKNETNDDIWVVTHGYMNNEYYAFRITGDSLQDTPVISQVGSIFVNNQGYMKISPNGEKIAAANPNGYDRFFEILDFDNNTGLVSDTNIVHNVNDCNAVEFSPDNTKFYSICHYIYQYDLEAGNPDQILASELQLSNQSVPEGALQIGPDGKVYCAMGTNNYLSVINEPNELGLACDFELDAIYLEGKQTTGGLPSFIQSYLNDPTFSTQNNCVGDATIFEITETNGIDSVFWRFNDFPNMPNDTSTLFSPSYTFSNAGTFYVDLTVYSGLLEKTVTQEVIIHPLPQPQLGNDTLFCDNNFSINLNANCDGDNYWWSTGQFGIPEIIVSDTGLYWVNVTKNGCSNADTINIGLYPQPQLDESNLVITDADCGQSNGSITGLQVTGTPPLSYYWLNVSGDTIGYNPDLLNLSTGSYSLIVTFGNDCSSTVANYLVHDIGNLQIDSVNFTNDHCNLDTATLTIYANAPNPDILTYSIDGVNFLSNGGIFTNLSQGSYEVMIKDTNDCEGNYINNPVVIQNISGVEITTEAVTPENDFSADGSIFLEAIVSNGDISYSIYNGNNPQINNGLFENLSAGIYDCKIWDDFGCDTIFEIIVPRNTTTLLEAISGFGNACVNDTVVSSLNIEQFNDVFSFEAKIYYNIYVVNCVGYIDLLPELEAGFNANITTPGEVKLTWQGTSPLTLPDTIMTKLVFGGLGEGISPVFWEAGPGQSVFFNQNMDTINAVCHVGNVQIYSSPEIDMQPNEGACAGDTIFVEPTVNEGNGTLIYSWSGPNSYQSQNEELLLSPASINQAGIYTLTVVDSMYCRESQSININVIPSPEIAFSEYDTLWVDPGFVLEAGYGAEYYYWNTGETTETIVCDSMGNYIVEVTSYENCKSTDGVQILWGGTPFYMPNAFTPNGDGLNDFFGPIPRYDYVNRYYMSIFNRWGQMIYETTDINKGWNGIYKGSPCMMGAYVYRIVYEEFGQQPIESKVVEGTVMLIR
ncbi:MAG: gliding motility-associated C-terminal domain-containing protein [Bacteroidetes bacterium]|nr:gliding motility-associated C-terminal domain-containing protein [Bacteroidota bacterium]